MPVRASERAVTVMGLVALLSALLVAITVPAAFTQTRTRLSSSKLATVYRIDLPGHTQTTVTPSTVHGIVWVAVTDGTVLVGEAAKAVKSGAAEWLEGKAPVGFRATDASAAQFVVADLSMALQGDRLENWASPNAIGPPDPNDPTKARPHRNQSLEPGGSIEEDSPQGETLFVAIAPLLLKVQINLAQEDGRWRLSEPTIMRLAAGEVRWTKPGIHLFANVGKTNARFVMLKW